MKDIKVVCTLKDIENMKNIFEKNSNIIIENLKKIQYKYNEMPYILNTPNSNKIIPQLNDIVKKYLELTNEKELYFKKTFNVIIDQYSNFILETGNKVGGVEDDG